MYSIDQHYVEENTTLAVFPKIGQIVFDLVDCLSKAITAARIVENNPADYEKAFRVLTDDEIPRG